LLTGRSDSYAGDQYQKHAAGSDQSQPPHRPPQEEMISLELEQLVQQSSPQIDAGSVQHEPTPGRPGGFDRQQS
ncbi:MAG: hypothetical protein ACREN8_07325, partial [Candidatus Dormibacteraceae bacterium]